MMMPPPPPAPVAYDFNWLDLDAVGQFAAMDDHVFAADAIQDVEAMWYGFGIESPDFGFTERQMRLMLLVGICSSRNL